jgi:uncharacterized damage-inducible protein DinB
MSVPGPLALTPEIEAFRKQFEQISAEADGLVAPLTDQQLGWQPAPGSWSVAECLDHLNVSARLYLPMLDEGIANAIRRGLYAPGPYSYNWIGRFLVHIFGPRTRARVKTMAPFQPPPGRTRHEIMAAFRAYQVQYIDRLRQANGLDLARARVSSPLARWVRMPLGSAFALMVAHERRHLAQARRVLAAQGVAPQA